MPKGIRDSAICSIGGCGQPIHGKTWCSLHYARWARLGDPLGVAVRHPPDHAARFWSHVDRSGECWTWKLRVTASGYARFWVDGKGVYAHVWAYTQLVGPVPDGMELDHLCRNRGCVNPTHVEPVTHAENCRRSTIGNIQAERTHCPRGHPYDDANTYRHGGRRACKECRREAARRWRQRIRETGLDA